MVRATRLLAAVALLCGLTACGSDPGAPEPATSSAPPAQSGPPRLAYQWLAGGGDGVFIDYFDGSTPSPIPDDSPGDQIHPDFSPDGESLAFIASTAEGGTVWIANADGSDQKEVAGCDAPCLFYDYVDWSPDGAELLLLRFNGPAGEGGIPASSTLVRLDLATGETSELITSEPFTFFNNPRWSPDGTSYCLNLLSGDDTGLTGSAIAVGSIDGGTPAEITERSEFGGYCDWHPTDNLLVFTTYDLQDFQEMDPERASNLFTVRPDGTELQPLTAYEPGGVRATQPRWSPDGQQIVFTKVEGSGMGSRTLAALTLADGSVGPIFGTEYINGTHPVLAPQH